MGMGMVGQRLVEVDCHMVIDEDELFWCADMTVMRFGALE